MTDRTKRPDIRPEWSILEKFLQVVCALILAAGVVMLIVSWNSLPKNIPIHFGLFGTPDSYGEKSRLIVWPVIFVGLYIVLTFLERFPRFFNFPFKINESNAEYSYKTAREMLVIMKTEAAAAFTYIIFAMIKTAKGSWNGLGQWFLIPFIVILVGTMVFYMIRLVKHKGGEADRLKQ